MTDPKTILIINFGFIGDVINASAVCQTLKKQYPEARLIFATLPCSQAIAQRIPSVSEVVTCDKVRNIQQLIELWRLAQYVKTNFAPTIALALENNTKSLTASLFACLTGAAVRVGRYAGMRRIFLTQGISYTREELAQNVHMSKMYQRTLQPLNLYNPSESLCLEASEQAKQRIDALLYEHTVTETTEYLIGLCPWSRLTKKDWQTEEIHKFSQALSSAFGTYKLVLVGDEASVLKMQNLPEQLIDLRGKTSLDELVALIAKLDILITVDTGPMHIAYALNKPTIALFFEHIFKRWGPQNSDARFKILYSTEKSKITSEKVIVAVQEMLSLLSDREVPLQQTSESG
jgi:ADP-heptose:LPS heptosyltransferase